MDPIAQQQQVPNIETITTQKTSRQRNRSMPANPRRVIETIALNPIKSFALGRLGFGRRGLVALAGCLEGSRLERDRGLGQRSPNPQGDAAVGPIA